MPGLRDTSAGSRGPSAYLYVGRRGKHRRVVRSVLLRTGDGVLLFFRTFEQVLFRFVGTLPEKTVMNSNKFSFRFFVLLDNDSVNKLVDK